MRKITNTIIIGEHNKPILTDYFYNENQTAKPIIIFCHGYKGYKDWGSWNLMAEYFSRNNFFFVKFNFSHNGGTVSQPIDFPDLDAFANNNFSIELDDLKSVIDSVLTNRNFEGEIDKSKIILIGHSRGGGIVNLKAGEDQRITTLITYAGISDIESRFPKGEALTHWKKTGIGYIENKRTKQQMPNKFQVYENFMANKERLHIQTAIENLRIPHLIIHGTEDDVVLIKEAENLHHWNKDSQLEIIKKMNHGLGNTQPWSKNKLPKEMEIVLKKTISFINKHV